MAVKYEANNYAEELKNELNVSDPSSHSARLLQKELKRLEQGGKEKEKNIPWVEVHPNNPQTVAARVYIPIKEFPKFNFVGKLLGPKGNSLKRLQDETGTKMSILGRGSMRDRAKEDELRKEGGKYAHLNEDLHVLVEVYSEITDAYQRMSHAIMELKKFMTPDYNDEIRQQQLQELMYMNGDKGAPGGGSRGGFRGAPRGGRGGAMGSGMPSGRGGPSGRGAAVRGAPTGGRGAGRGAPVGRGRGQPAPPVQQSYDDYGSSGYDEGYGNSSYGDQGYDQGYGQDTQYFDYGHGSGGSGYDDYGESGWGSSSSGPMKPAVGRGGAKGQFRSHPYGGRGGGGNSGY